MDSFLEVIRFIIELFFYLMIAYGNAWYFYNYKKKALPGRFLGSLLIAFIGAIILSLISGPWFISFTNWLMTPKFGENFIVRVNLITAFLGSFIFLWFYNYINHDKTRRD
ncbi:MAG: hypothetical protein ACK4UJ_06410 [Leptonema sp. (in: bacteria)]